MSRNLLTARLKKLVAGGVLIQQPVAENGRRLEYVLTPMGEDLGAMIVAMRQWGDRWLFSPNAHPADMIDVVDETVIPPLEIRSSAGRRVSPSDIRLRSRLPAENA